MNQIEKYFQSDDYLHKNIGGMLLHLLDTRKIGQYITQVSIQVANQNWWGNFTVPEAIGFSTPIALLKGAVVFVDSTEGEQSQLYSKLKSWRMTYATSVSKREEDITYTNDLMECTICQTQYEKGDKITKLNCGHMFHLQCSRQWALSKKETIKDKLSYVLSQRGFGDFDNQNDVVCPLCNK